MVLPADTYVLLKATFFPPCPMRLALCSMLYALFARNPQHVITDIVDWLIS
jgi:hypothetical protein